MSLDRRGPHTTFQPLTRRYWNGYWPRAGSPWQNFRFSTALLTKLYPPACRPTLRLAWRHGDLINTPAWHHSSLLTLPRRLAFFFWSWAWTLSATKTPHEYSSSLKRASLDGNEQLSIKKNIVSSLLLGSEKIIVIFISIGVESGSMPSTLR